MKRFIPRAWPAPAPEAPTLPVRSMRGAFVWTVLAYLVLSLVVVAVWTYYARTEVDVDALTTIPAAVTPSGERISRKFNSIVCMAQGKAWAPFVGRRLLPDLARHLAALVPPRAWGALAAWIEGDAAGAAWVRDKLQRLSWKAEHLPLLLCATALIYLSVVGFMFSCRWLTLVLYECPTWVAGVLGGVLGLALLGGNTDWHYFGYPYDFPNAFVFTLALTALLARRWGWFAVAFAAAVYSKETSVLLIGAFGLLADDRRSLRFWGVLALLLGVYGGIRAWIAVHFPGPDGVFWFPRRNGRHLLFLAFYGWLAPFLAVAFARLVAARRLYPAALKKLCLLGLPLIGLAYFKGWIEELRQYLELLPITGLIVLHWMLHEAGAGGLLRARPAPGCPCELTDDDAQPWASARRPAADAALSKAA